MPELEISPEAESPSKTEEAVLFVPGALFFCETVEIPEEVGSGELSDYAELTLEGLSPFPLRDLLWGFWADPATRQLLLYAALRGKVERAIEAPLDKATFVLPDFISLAGTKFAEPTEVRLQGQHATYALRFPADATAFTIDLAASEAQSSKSALHFVYHGYAVTDDSVTFQHVPVEGGEIREDDTPGEITNTTFAGDAIWQADIRDRFFKAAERTRRKRDQRLMAGIGIAAVVAVLLLCTQIGLALFGQNVRQLTAQRTAQQDRVLAIQDRHSLLITLEQISTSELRPLDVLEALNRVRPAEIYFTEARAEPINRMTLDGVASTVNALTRYTNALRESGDFQLVGEPRTLVRGGRTTFTLVVDYTGELPVIPRPVIAAPSSES